MDFAILFERLQQCTETRAKLEIDLDNPDVKPELVTLE